ncbi:PLDc N-terminal domain-containing protein [Bacteroides sp. Marseille-P3684]|uniref:PLDc N-terminal domain-containing protein n=1 Tax=Bacteroides sp. Marseille-P3684 TaxID=2086579 RepID=UPI000D0AE4B0|nr:PLDc N-terminal domain-containing protein [Bacteroides sp. Marseille-P3684]
MDLMTPDVQLYFWAWLNWLLLVIDAAFVLYAIVQLLQDKTWSSIAKWIWAVVIVGMNFLGVLLYLLFGRGKGKRVCKEDNLPVV